MAMKVPERLRKALTFLINDQGIAACAAHNDALKEVIDELIILLNPNFTGHTGRPGSRYEVQLTDYATWQVQGVTEAHELLTKLFKDNPGNGAPPKLASLRVMLASAKGQWSRRHPFYPRDFSGQTYLTIRKLA